MGGEVRRGVAGGRRVVLGEGGISGGRGRGCGGCGWGEVVGMRPLIRGLGWTLRRSVVCEVGVEGGLYTVAVIRGAGVEVRSSGAGQADEIKEGNFA